MFLFYTLNQYEIKRENIIFDLKSHTLLNVDLDTLYKVRRLHMYSDNIAFNKNNIHSNFCLF